ncbi:MAG: 30S ribosomal protein S2 [Actinobacteria bacterium]|nr:30S ribosomal protein S2 [Actinomycetota bacterium]
MPVVTMRQLLEAGVHFGHQTRRWNPKMRDYIFGERNGIYIIDLQQTLARVDEAYRFIRDLVAGGGSVLFVGTKKQAQEPIERHARAARMPFVNYRWLGGMLTNFQTIRQRVDVMLALEQREREGEFDIMPKKEGLRHRRELEKLQRYLGGIRNLESAPKAIFVIDTKREDIAVREANKLGVPVVAVVDTNCDPELIDYVIPGNDDAIRSATLLCRVIADAVEEGHLLAGDKRRSVAAAAQALEPEPLDPEEEARRAEQQAKARAEAMAAQRAREKRLAMSRAQADAPAPEAPAPEGPAPEAPAPEEHDG